MKRTEQINSACVMHDTRTHTHGGNDNDQRGWTKHVVDYVSTFNNVSSLSFSFSPYLFICPNHIDKLRRQYKIKYHILKNKCIFNREIESEDNEIFRSAYFA
jgi:hypothetical protein